MKTPETGSFTLTRKSLLSPQMEKEVEKTADEEFVLKNVLPSDNGYLIRPMVAMKGQLNGYKWSLDNRGGWQSFLKERKKNFTLKNTGMFFKTIYYS